MHSVYYIDHISKNKRIIQYETLRSRGTYILYKKYKAKYVDVKFYSVKI